MSNILVYALHYEGAFNKNSLGAVAEASRLAGELGGEAHAVVIGEGIADDLASTLGSYGATKVYKAEGPEGLSGPVIDLMGKLFDGGDYQYAVFGGGLLGFEIGAGLAARIDAGVTMEVTGVNVVDGQLAAERPILGDSSISTSRYKGKGIIIARLNAFEVKEMDPPTRPATVENLDVELSPQAQQANIVTRGEQRGADVDIEGASILVAGGRGLGKAEGFQLAEDLAKAFGGNSAVAATRAVVDAGWYPYAAQIGQTGKTVAPKLYLAAGISGAIQHKVGMQSSENIVAINKDANAPIFEFSDLGIVGDLNKILPKLTEAVKARKG
jgi:electron transfer flavoprotein alpha subunit